MIYVKKLIKEVVYNVKFIRVTRIFIFYMSIYTKRAKVVFLAVFLLFTQNKKNIKTLNSVVNNLMFSA